MSNSAAVLEVEVVTDTSPPDAGTQHPLYFSAMFDGLNFARSKRGRTGCGETEPFDFELPSHVLTLRSLSIRLNGLAPTATDNWLPQRFKVTFRGDVLVDRDWDLWFDENNRSHEIYRREFEPTETAKGEAEIENYRVKIVRALTTVSLVHTRGIVLYPKSVPTQTQQFSEIRIHFVEDFSDDQLGGVNTTYADRLDPIMPISDFEAVYDMLRSAFDKEYAELKCHWGLDDSNPPVLTSFAVDGTRMG